MRADEMVARHGKSLIGKVITTKAMGDYPGGHAIITELTPDPAAPEIPIQVRHSSFGIIGVFEHEEVNFYTGPNVPFTAKVANGIITIKWNNGEMAVVPFIDHKEANLTNPIVSGRLTAVRLKNGTIIEGNMCHRDNEVPLTLRLPEWKDPKNHYDYLKTCIKRMPSLFHSPQHTEVLEANDSHKGQIFNPYTERWSWI